MKRTLMISVLASAFSLSTSCVFAADPPAYGSQMMTQQERTEHRDQMRNATSYEEKEKIRSEQHEKMKEKAKEQGINMPDKPPAGSRMSPSGNGMGPGSNGGMGSGMMGGPGPAGNGVGPGGYGMGVGGGKNH